MIDKKTISLQWYDRPDFAKKSLDWLSNCVGISEWDIYVFLDWSDKETVQEHKKLIDQVPLDIENVFVSHENQGVAISWDRTMKIVFEYICPDFHFHLEDDILVGPDTLLYAEECRKYLKDGAMSISAFSHKSIISTNDVVHKRNGFHCWGFFVKPEWYEKVYKNVEKESDHGRAHPIDNVYNEKGYYELCSELRRSKNIGIEVGVHPGTNSDTSSDTPLWTGGDLFPSANPQLCPDCREGDCDTVV